MDFIIVYEEFIRIPPGSGDNLLTLMLAGVSYCDGSYSIRRPPSKTFVFEYVEKGSGVLHTDGQFFYPVAGDVYMAPGWKAHSYASDAKMPWVKHWFNLSGRFVETLLNLYGLENTYLYKDCRSGGEIILGTLKDLKQLSSASGSEVSVFMQRRLLELIIELAKYRNTLLRTEYSPDKNEQILMAYLKSRILGETPSLEEISGLIGRSPVQTIRTFKKAFGTTPFDYLCNEKMKAACEFLRSSAKSVKEIAEILGYQDEYYFSRIFKKRNGVAPSFYRKWSRDT